MRYEKSDSVTLDTLFMKNDINDATERVRIMEVMGGK